MTYRPVALQALVLAEPVLVEPVLAAAAIVATVSGVERVDALPAESVARTSYRWVTPGALPLSR